MSSPESFYYLDEDSKKTVGPFTWDVLERMNRAALISDDTLLLGETQTEWKSFGALKNEIRDSRAVLAEPARSETSRTVEKTQPPSAELETDPETEVRDIPTAATPNVDENENTPTNRLVWRFIVIGLIIVSALAVGLMGNSSLRQGQDLTPADTLPPHDTRPVSDPSQNKPSTIPNDSNDSSILGEYTGQQSAYTSRVFDYDDTVGTVIHPGRKNYVFQFLPEAAGVQRFPFRDIQASAKRAVIKWELVDSSQKSGEYAGYYQVAKTSNGAKIEAVFSPDWRITDREFQSTEGPDEFTIRLVDGHITVTDDRDKTAPTFSLSKVRSSRR
jgi:hypothetical protein